MDETLLTPLKGVAFLLAVFLLFYPVVLLGQLATGTVTESLGQIALLLGLSGLSWAWVVRLYRRADVPGVRMTPPE